MQRIPHKKWEGKQTRLDMIGKIVILSFLSFLFFVSIRKQFARVFISFKENQFFASRRSELYGKIDFIASIGGIMGLFMGVSLLSIVEFFYFGTLRLGCNLRSRRIEKRRLSEKQRFLSPASIDAPSASAPTDTTDTTEIFPENKY